MTTDNLAFMVGGAAIYGLAHLIFNSLYKYFRKVYTSDNIHAIKSDIGVYDLANQMEKTHYSVSREVKNLKENNNERFSDLYKELRKIEEIVEKGK